MGIPLAARANGWAEQVHVRRRRRRDGHATRTRGARLLDPRAAAGPARGTWETRGRRPRTGSWQGATCAAWPAFPFAHRIREIAASLDGERRTSQGATTLTALDSTVPVCCGLTRTCSFPASRRQWENGAGAREAVC